MVEFLQECWDSVGIFLGISAGYLYEFVYDFILDFISGFSIKNPFKYSMRIFAGIPRAMYPVICLVIP